MIEFPNYISPAKLIVKVSFHGNCVRTLKIHNYGGKSAQKPGDEFTKRLQDRIDRALLESTEILTNLLQRSVPDAEDIQLIKSMTEKFATKPTEEDTNLDPLWQSIFDSIISQDREKSFERVMHLLYRSASFGFWGWQVYAIASLDVLKMAEEDEKRKPNDINVLMGFLTG